MPPALGCKHALDRTELGKEGALRVERHRPGSLREPLGTRRATEVFVALFGNFAQRLRVQLGLRLGWVGLVGGLFGGWSIDWGLERDGMLSGAARYGAGGFAVVVASLTCDHLRSFCTASRAASMLPSSWKASSLGRAVVRFTLPHTPSELAMAPE